MDKNGPTESVISCSGREQKPQRLNRQKRAGQCQSGMAAPKQGFGGEQNVRSAET